MVETDELRKSKELGNLERLMKIYIPKIAIKA